MFNPNPVIPGGFEIFWAFLSGLVFLIAFVVVVGILVLLVRFLLIGTKAAQLYVAKNSPAEPQATTAPAAPAAPVQDAPSSVAPGPATTGPGSPAVTKPASTPRATKPPTAN